MMTWTTVARRCRWSTGGFLARARRVGLAQRAAAPCVALADGEERRLARQRRSYDDVFCRRRRRVDPRKLCTGAALPPAPALQPALVAGVRHADAGGSVTWVELVLFTLGRNESTGAVRLGGSAGTTGTRKTGRSGRRPRFRTRRSCLLARRGRSRRWSGTSSPPTLSACRTLGAARFTRPGGLRCLGTAATTTGGFRGFAGGRACRFRRWSTTCCGSSSPTWVLAAARPARSPWQRPSPGVGYQSGPRVGAGHQRTAAGDAGVGTFAGTVGSSAALAGACGPAS